MSKARSTREPVSDSDASDPTFVPSPQATSSPRRRASKPTQRRNDQRGQTQLNTTTRFRSSPPIIPSSSKYPQHRNPSPLQAQSSQSARAHPASSQDDLQPLHPGPFTSSPPPLPRPKIQLQQSQSRSQSPSPTRSPNFPTQTGPLRPNKYLGPPSTWRAWTKPERTVVQSLERIRAQDLSVHLYNAHALRQKAEQSKAASRSRSRSRSQSRNQRKKVDVKGKGKAKPDLPGSPAPEFDEEPTFDPPRLWTAWPLPPSDVPREELLPTKGLLGGYRSKKDSRPSAELEECLLAATSRYARLKWEVREWESEDEEVGRSKRRKTDDKPTVDFKIDSLGVNTDVQMEDETSPPPPSIQDERPDNDEVDNDTSSPSPSTSPNPDIQMFSSQLFTAPSPSPSPSSSSSSTSNSSPPPDKPTFLADDDRLRQLLLPSTRHVISQLDELLRALHTVGSYRRRKTVGVGVRGWEEVLGIAGVVFDPEVVRRAKGRCERLFGVDATD